MPNTVLITMKKTILAGLILAIILFSGCTQNGNESGYCEEKIKFIRKYPLKEGWSREERSPAGNPKPIASFAFSNEELICKRNVMMGGAREPEMNPFFFFNFYSRGGGVSGPIMGVPPFEQIDSGNCTIQITTFCESQRAEFDFINELIQNLRK